MAEGDELSRLITTIAAATTRYPFKVWGFGESIAMHGLLGAGDAGREFAARLLCGWACQARPLAQNPLTHVAPGVPALVLYRVARDEALLKRCIELAGVLEAMPRGQHGARIHRPDLPGWEHEVWVDCMHLDGPFLVALGRELGEQRWFDLGVDLLLSHARVLQDGRSGLFSHGFDDAAGLANGVFWGRGQCWALVGLVDTLRELSGAGHSDELELRDRLSSLVAGLDATEADGRWHTVVNHSKTYLEASVGAFVAHGVFEAIDCGLVDATHRGMAERAWQATIARVNEDGELVGVSDATPVGADAAHYAARARGVFPWGQGPALLAAQNRRTHLLIP